MNYKELEKLLNDYFEKRQNEMDEDEDGNFDYENALTEFIEEGFDEKELPIKLVYETPSYDGESKEWVYEHKNGDESIFVMFDGYYSSYEGIEVEDGFKEVKPYTFTETRYK